MATSRQKVYVVDDDSSVRTALSRFFKSVGFEVRTYSSAEAFLEEEVAPDAPACLVLDMKMPGISGTQLQEELHRRGAALPIVFISGYGTLPVAVQAMKGGAIDFLEKPLETRALFEAVSQAIERASEGASKQTLRDELTRRYRLLTGREREVFGEVTKGKLNKQIAVQLGTTEKTIKVHRARVMRKMQARSVADLVRIAVELSA
jgi:FixJ family two-component response regulator